MAVFPVPSLQTIIVILYPFVWLSQWITSLIKTDHTESVLSRTDISAIADMGAKEGIIEKNKHQIIKNLLKLRRIYAEDIMTPRTVVKAADDNMTIGESHGQNPELRCARIPVYAEKLHQ